MVSFNSKDYNLARIKTEAKIHNLVTEVPYRIYGTIQSEHPLIYISYFYDEFENGNRLLDRQNLLQKFFAHNNIEVEIDNEDEFNYGGKQTIGIGLRRDLRSYVVLSASIIQTIIYTFEGRLKLKTNKIPSLPKFKKE